MNLLHEVALFLVPRIGNINYKQLIKHCGSAEEVFKLPKGKLKRIQGIGEQTASSIINKNTFAEAEKIIEQADTSQILYYLSPEYPQRLLKYDDCPALLFYQGNADLNPARAISIVGTRNITENGIKTVKNIVKDIAPFSAQIISGLAYGVDFNAHQQALHQELDTIGVMASGIDIIYPAAHKQLANKMLNHGGLITEQSFGSQPDAPKFPARNRIIAGMSDAVIVVEAATKGGALITAKLANSYNIEVLACPGRLTDDYNTGCNHLIENHEAHIYTSIKSLTSLLGWEDDIKKASKPLLDISTFSNDEQKILKALQNEGSTMNDLVKSTELNFAKVPAILLKLEMEDILVVKTGGIYALKD